jgi:hypothetical protein
VKTVHLDRVIAYNEVITPPIVYLRIVGQHKIIKCSGVKPISNFTVVEELVQESVQESVWESVRKPIWELI